MNSNSIALRDLPRALRPRWKRMAVAGGVVFGVAAAVVLLVPPRYRAEALLRVQSQSAGEGLLGSMDELSGVSALGLGRDEVETEVGVLSSRRMQDAAIDSLGMEAVMTRPRDYDRDGLVEVHSRGESTLEGTLTLERSAPDRWSVSAGWTGDSAAVPATVAANAPFAVGPLAFRIFPGAPARMEFRLRPRYQVYEALDSRLEVRRRSTGSKLIELRYEDRDRHLAARVIDVILGAYLGFVTQGEQGDAGRTIAGLRRTADSVAAALRTADESLRDYQASSRLVAPTEQATLQVRRVAGLRSELDKVEVEREALQRLLTLVDERARGGRDASAYRQLATFPALISNRAIQDLLASLIALETERSKLTVRRSDDNPDVRAVNARIEELERDLRRLGSQYLESLEQQMRETSNALQQMTADLGGMPSAEMRYVRLARERTMLGESWILLQKQLRQAEVQDALRQDRVRLVDPPRVPQVDEAIFPRPAVHLTLGLVLALLASLAVGLVGLRPPQDESDWDHLPIRPRKAVEEAGASSRGNGPAFG
ncbi:MAG: GumC family protein [Gemmatimonadaceae bacterium]